MKHASGSHRQVWRDRQGECSYFMCMCAYGESSLARL